MDWLFIFREGFRMFKRRLNPVIIEYPGDASEICRAVVENCWTGKLFIVSPSNYPVFYCRDFGMVVDALLSQGHTKRVRKTLGFVLESFSLHGRVTTTLRQDGKCFDFPKYAPDSLAFLLYALVKLNDSALISQYKNFLESQLDYFYETVIEKEGEFKGYPKEKHFSSMKDYAIRKRSCYDFCMCYLVKKSADALGLHHKIHFDFKKLVIRYFTGDYFLDDLSGKTYIAGDANVMPFWTGLVTDKKIFEKVYSQIKKHELDFPFPLRYTHEDNNETDMVWLEFFAKDWEKHVLWSHLGYLYIDILRKFRPKKADLFLKEYGLMIEKYKNQLEVFTPEKKPYKSSFYFCSDSMIWAANYLK